MNSFGRMFRISIFGESHGQALGVVVDGCPSGISLSENDFKSDLAKRKSGAKGTTSRIEPDMPKIMSGVFNNLTTGAPINVMFENTNTRSRDYSNLINIPRPGHADFVAQKKYNGYSDYRGGGHFSGRVTLGLVVAGVIAKKIISSIKIEARILEIGGKSNIEEAIDLAIENNDSVGGILECETTGIPVGLGEPFFDSVESVISHLVFSIPGIKAIEFGAGFKAAQMTGSVHNDNIISVDGKTQTNNAGGINGGITNGNNIVFRVAVKPTSSTDKIQNTINLETGELVDLQIVGRHDKCIALRIPIILEAVTAIALADLSLINRCVVL